jgi:uncharacterized protein (TIGR03118 family)
MSEMISRHDDHIGAIQPRYQGRLAHRTLAAVVACGLFAAAGAASAASAVPNWGGPPPPPPPAAANAVVQHYQQTNLVGNASGLGATVVDPKLVDPWDISRSTSGPWWVADRATGVATVYDGTGAKAALTVTVPHGSPTGQIFNGSSDFALAPGKPALYLFVSLTGAISGWNPAVNGTKAVQKVAPSARSVLTGATLAQVGNRQYLYVADLKQAKISVYDTKFAPVSLGAHAFVDPDLPTGYAPFNVQNIGNNLYVAYAQQSAAKNFVNFGAGLGYVDVFSPAGELIRRLQHGNWFNAPFGLVLAPTDFGNFSHKLIVGQFGSGTLLAFDDQTGKFEGYFTDKNSKVISIPGLWALSFGAGQPSPQSSGPGNALFFAAGIKSGNGGLFGTLTPLPADLTQGNDQ